MLPPRHRSRLHNTGLKLKIPIRNLNSSLNNNNGGAPYGPGPRQSPGGSGGGSRKTPARSPHWPAGGSSPRIGIPSAAATCCNPRKIVTFDAAVDCRPVWEVQREAISIDNADSCSNHRRLSGLLGATAMSPKTVGSHPSTVSKAVGQSVVVAMSDEDNDDNDKDEFREIPIQIVRDNGGTVNIVARDHPSSGLAPATSRCSPRRPPQHPGRLDQTPRRETTVGRSLTSRQQKSPVIAVSSPVEFITCDSEPVTPVLDLSSPPVLAGDPPVIDSPAIHLEKRAQRAIHVYEWFCKLSPRIPPRKPANTSDLKTIQFLRTLNLHTNRAGSPNSSILTSSDGSILTPTDNSIMENPLLTANQRRDSSGALQSPDVLDPAKEDGFYLLKKDSQRRATLVKVLQHDKHNICSTWHSLLLKDIQDPCLSEQHLSTLMEGLRGYIPEQNREPLETALGQLREDLDYDGAKINQLQLALYNFQDAVNSVLRVHSIKPHWMFALDNLVRAAVQAAILVLSPELGAHLADPGLAVGDHPADVMLLPPDLPLDHEGSTSGVSTVNSAFQGTAGGGGVGAHPNSLLSNLSKLREENRQLLTDLVQAQYSYQELLKQSLSEQKLHLQLLSQSLAASSLAVKSAVASGNTQDDSSGSGQSDLVWVNSSTDTKTTSESDSRLVHWLRELGLNQETVSRVTSEDLSLGDVVDLMTRDDLRRLGLKAGPELRIWRAILRHREGGDNSASNP